MPHDPKSKKVTDAKAAGKAKDKQPAQASELIADTTTNEE